MIGILGAGFGLYGHLPALAGLGLEIQTLERYRPAIERRPELKPFSSALFYVPTEDQILRESRVVVLARRPSDNAELITEKLLRASFIPRLVVEKPLGTSPHEAAELHKQLLAHGCYYRIPYTFAYCEWAAQLLAELARGGETSFRLIWNMPFRNSSSSWKYDSDMGGGVLSYYLIHILALLAFPNSGLGRLSVAYATKPTRTTVALKARIGAAAGIARFELVEKQPRFIVEVGRRQIFDGPTPFGAQPVPGFADPRIQPLQRFYEQELLIAASDDKATAERYEEITRLWDCLTPGPSAVESQPPSRFACTPENH